MGSTSDGLDWVIANTEHEGTRETPQRSSHVVEQQIVCAKDQGWLLDGIGDAGALQRFLYLTLATESG